MGSSPEVYLNRSKTYPVRVGSLYILPVLEQGCLSLNQLVDVFHDISDQSSHKELVVASPAHQTWTSRDKDEQLLHRACSALFCNALQTQLAPEDPKQRTP